MNDLFTCKLLHCSEDASHNVNILQDQACEGNVDMKMIYSETIVFNDKQCI